MTIITASINDAATIATIIREANEDVARQFGLNADNCPKHPSLCQTDWVLTDFNRGEEYFLYQQDGVDIGCVAFEQPKPEVAYLNRLSVLPQYRHHGIGRSLVQFVFGYARQKNITRVSIGIIAENVRLRNWYLNLGFREGERKIFPHLPFDVLYMSASISAAAL